MDRDAIGARLQQAVASLTSEEAYYILIDSLDEIGVLRPTLTRTLAEVPDKKLARYVRAVERRARVKRDG